MKRNCPDDSSEQAIKKLKQCSISPRRYSPMRSKEARSASCERTLQLLYQGATKQFRSAQDLKDVGTATCFFCHVPLSRKNHCGYCERNLCQNCTNFCSECQDDFCKNCSFMTFKQNQTICYTCYK